MTSVQSSDFNYKPFLEPTAFVSFALLAGFTRVIEYLPGASRGGILLSGAMATTGSVIYNQMRLDPERSYARTLLEKTAVLALANIGAMLLAKPLQGRLSLCPTRKLGLVQFVFTAIATKLNKVTETPLTPLQKDHLKYSTHQREWRALSIEDRTKLAKDFYDANLPGICLFEAHIDVKALNPVFADYFQIQPHEPRGERKERKYKMMGEDDDFLFSSDKPPMTPKDFEKHLDTLSTQQLSWLREILQGETQLLDKLRPQELFSLLKRFQEKGIETVRFGKHDMDFLQETPAYLTLLYQEFQKEPIYGLALHQIYALLQDKDPLPTLKETAKALSKEKIQTMDPELIMIWHHMLMQDEVVTWNTLDPSIQSAFVQRFVKYKEFVPFYPHFRVDSLNIQWLNDFSEKELEELSKNQLAWVHPLLQLPKLQQQLSFKTTHALNEHHELDLPYKLTHDVVVAAEKDNDLVQALHRQTWRTSAEEKGKESSGPYFDLTGLSEADQSTLRALFDSAFEDDDY